MKISYLLPSPSRTLALISSLFYCVGVYADNGEASVIVSSPVETTAIASKSDEIWYEQSFQDILNAKIITSTRNESSVNDAPGVVTVYSSQDIQRMGLRSVKELLERTTGFFINRQLTGATIGSRGFIADTDQFLMLIDGHSMNSIIDRGMGETFLFPNLEHVDRVEIIRGPGSTLWGSDASLGVIHIITKDGADIDGMKVTVNRSDDNAKHVNLQVGEALTEDIDVMASLTVAESEGFDVIAAGGQPVNGLVGRWDEVQDSYEFYAKARVRNLTIKARAYQSTVSRPFLDFVGLNESQYSERSHYYLDITHSKDFGESFNLETRVFSDVLQRIQASASALNAVGTTTGVENQASQEDRLGVEMIGRWHVSDAHQLLMGFKKVRTNMSPVTENMSYPVNTSSTDLAGTVNHLVVPDDVDDNTAIFIEDAWQIIPNKLSAVAGMRFDKNNLREDSVIALPRLALNWRVYEPLQIKYSYNTGYIRPSAGIGFLGQERYFNYGADAVKRVGIKASQEIASHDIQFIYSENRFRGNLNIYYTEVDNPFQILLEPDNPAAPNRVAYYLNTNTVTTSGAELELAYQFSKAFDVYASLAYVFDASVDSMTGTSAGINYDLNHTEWGFGEGTYTPEGTMSAYPHLISHLGMNWNVFNNMVGNLHLRYWDNMVMRDAFDGDATLELGPEAFVDMNMRFPGLFGTELDASVFVKNLLDNADSVSTMMFYSNVWQDKGRRIGGSLSYSF